MYNKEVIINQVNERPVFYLTQIKNYTAKHNISIT